MRAQRVAETIAAVLALILVAVVAFLGLLYLGVVVLRAGAVYAVSLPLAGGTWYWLDRPLAVPETVGIAVVASAGVVALTLPDPGSLVVGWFVLQMTAPTAFMLPLGTASTWRQRSGVVVLVVLPALSFLFNGFVLHPESSGTPQSLVFGTVAFLALFSVVGVPLFALGRYLAREDDPLRDVAGRIRRSSAPE